MADDHKDNGNGALAESEGGSGPKARPNGGQAAAAAHGHDGHDHGLSHVTPVNLLVTVWLALMVLTGITVAVTLIDLGPRLNLIIAMAIATIKAGLVVTYFMHLRWDRPFNTLIFLGSLLFVSLFISMTLLDKSEYERDIQEMYLEKGQ
jgi:cytochrome c oxidase subunit IV